MKKTIAHKTAICILVSCLIILVSLEVLTNRYASADCISPISYTSANNDTSSNNTSTSFTWYYSSDGNGTYYNTRRIDLELNILDGSLSYSEIYYTVSYNGELLMSSAIGDCMATFSTYNSNAYIIDRFLAPGDYEITFWKDDDTRIARATAHVFLSEDILNPYMTYDLETVLDYPCPSQLILNDGKPKVIIFGDLYYCGLTIATYKNMQKIKDFFSDTQFDVYFFQIRNYDPQELYSDVSQNFTMRDGDYFIYNGSSSEDIYGSLFYRIFDKGERLGIVTAGEPYSLPLIGFFDGNGRIVDVSSGYKTIEEITDYLSEISIPTHYDPNDLRSHVTYFLWYPCTDCNGIYGQTSYINVEMFYDNANLDWSGVYYTVSYNGSLIYTSPAGETDAYYRTYFSEATSSFDYLPIGQYVFTFYGPNNEILGEQTATVTESPYTSATASSSTITNPTITSSSSGDAGDFVERLYTVALGRNSDPVGQQQWVNTITSGQNTGADVARGFLYSGEFLNKNSTNSEFVQTLYRTFFGREADEGGLASWIRVLESGETRQNVIEGFINSTEWANLCLAYGISSGGTGTPSINVEPNQATIDFATRLYTTCLNRTADENGLMAWARQLANQRETGTGAARGFFFSAEFSNQHVDNGEYVTRLYRTFMGREPDQAGYNAWVGQLDSGISREEVFNGFAQSQEFTQICAQYGIIRG